MRRYVVKRLSNAGSAQSAGMVTYFTLSGGRSLVALRSQLMDGFLKWSCPESGVNREHGRRFRFTTCKSAKKEVTPVPVRVSATDRIRTKIDALFAEDRELPEILEEVARLGAQLLMQAALEAEVTEFLGRERYQRLTQRVSAGDGQNHHRAGHVGAAEAARHHCSVRVAVVR